MRKGETSRSEEDCTIDGTPRCPGDRTKYRFVLEGIRASARLAHGGGDGGYDPANPNESEAAYSQVPKGNVGDPQPITRRSWRVMGRLEARIILIERGCLGRYWAYPDVLPTDWQGQIVKCA